MTKPTIPDVIDKFRAYYYKPGNAMWGSLHIVLSDGNVDDHDVLHCLAWAIDEGDTEGAELAKILLSMSRTQRLKIGDMLSTERYAPGGVEWREEDKRIAKEFRELCVKLMNMQSEHSDIKHGTLTWEAEIAGLLKKYEQMKNLITQRFVDRAERGI